MFLLQWLALVLVILHSESTIGAHHRHRHHSLHSSDSSNNNNDINNNSSSSNISKYIIVESDGGLANRLRVLVSYYFIAKHYYDNYHLFMVWEVNDACPGHFLSIFQPIDDVTFITNTTRSILLQSHQHMDDIISYPNTRDGFELTMEKLEIDVYLKHKHKIRNIKRYLWSQEKELWWSLMKPLIDIERRAFQYAREHDICNSSAIHIRRTDLWTELKSIKRTGYEVYDQWINQLPSSTTNIYLMTDNPKTQQRFVDKYQHRIKVYNSISSTTLVNKPISINTAKVSNSDLKVNSNTLSGHDSNGTNLIYIQDGSSRIVLNQTLDEYASPLSTSILPIDYRYTTIEHALMDVLIASHAKYFHPAGYSSMSDFTKTMRTMHRWDYCDCQHRTCFD